MSHRSSPGQGHCTVFLGKKFYSHSQVYKWVLANLMLGVAQQWTSIPWKGGVEILLVALCFRHWDKLWPDGPFGLYMYVDFTSLYLLTWPKIMHWNVIWELYFPLTTDVFANLSWEFQKRTASTEFQWRNALFFMKQLYQLTNWNTKSSKISTKLFSIAMNINEAFSTNAQMTW